MRNSFTLKLNWFWENAESILIVLFLASFSFNIRKVFLTPYSFLNGEFNEYLTINFSWADFLMITVILIYTTKWLIRQSLQPNSRISTTEYINGYMSSVSNFFRTISYETFFLSLFLLWVLLSVSWSAYKPIAVYRFFTLLEVIVFFAILATKLRDYKWLKIGIYALLLNGTFQAGLGIAQFLHNESLGLKLLSESIVSPDLPGVAKIIFNGEKHIRAYGTFPHPNVLAGFLIIPISILVGLIIEGIGHYKKNTTYVPRSPRTTGPQSWHLGHNPSGTYPYSRTGFLAWLPVVRGESLDWKIPLLLPATILFITLIGFTLTFSRSTFLGFAIVLAIFFSIKLKGSKYLAKSLLAFWVMIIVFLGCYFVSQTNLKFLLSSQSIQERSFYLSVSREIISSHPLFGIGAGQLVFQEYMKHPNLPGWQYQPVHNLYFLIASELGLSGLVLALLALSFFLLKTLKHANRPNKLTWLPYYCIILSYLIISFFDHYFWDIKMGIIIFAIAFWLLIKSSTITSVPTEN